MRGDIILRGSRLIFLMEEAADSPRCNENYFLSVLQYKHHAGFCWSLKTCST